ncbi:MAG: hypothetical protein ACKV2Q_23625 [Planctomycetaceae bacterium]
MCLKHWFRRRHSMACLTISIATLVGVWPLYSGERPVVQNIVPKSEGTIPGPNDPIRHAILSREVHREKAGTRRFKPSPSGIYWQCRTLGGPSHRPSVSRGSVVGLGCDFD